MMQAVIFDMDGLMVDSEPLQLRAVNEALQPLGITLSDADWMNYIGRKSLDIFRHLLATYGLDPIMHDAKALDDTKVAAYQTIIRLPGEIVPMPGLYAAIDACGAMGLRRAIASSSVRQDVLAILELLGLSSAFETITAGDEVTIGKPDPAIFLTTAERLAADPADCLVLEDSPHGIAAARAAGMTTVAIPNRFSINQDFSQADLIFGNLDDFAHHLRQTRHTN